MSWTATIERYLAEGRTVSGGKDDKAIQSQQMQQMSFNKQLASIFSTQFGQQSGILNFLNQKLTSIANNPNGLTPEAKAALTTQNTEGAAKDFAAAQTATQSIEAGRGGSSLPSGVSAQLTAANANAGAATKAAGDQNIALEDQNLKQQNEWNALNGLDQVASAENPTGYGSLYNGGSSNVGTLGTDYSQTENNPLLSTLGGAAGAGLTALAKH